MKPKNIQVTFQSESEARKAYDSGLRHGLVTTPLSSAPDEGTPCRVSLTLAWTKQSFPMLGAVVHASPVATVIRVETLPAELHMLLGGEDAAPPPPVTETPTLSPEDPSPPMGEKEISSTESLGDLPEVERSDPLPPRKSRKPEKSKGNPWAKRLAAASKTRAQAQAKRAQRDGPAASTPSRPTAAVPAPATPRTSAAPASPPPAANGTTSGIPVPFQPGRFLPGVALYEGTLPRHSLYQAFLQVHVTRLTGVGVIQSPRDRYWSFFLHGRPVHFLREPPLQKASTESLMVRHKLLNEAVLDRARWLSEITARPLMSVVMRLGLLRPEQLQTLRQEQTELVIKRVLGIRAGTYWFYEMPEIAEVFGDDDADTLALMWRRAQFEVAAMKPELVGKKIAAVGGKVFERTKMGQQLLPELPLTEEQRGAVENHVRNGWSVQAAVEKSGLPTDEASRLILTLSTLGMISCVEAVTDHRDQAAAEQGLLHRHARAHRNHFDYLEVHWSALPHEVEQACSKVDDMLEEASALEDPVPGSADMIRDVRERISEIRSLFRDKRARAAYRAELVGVDKRRMAAELYLKQGEMAMFKRDVQGATECFERLLELDPGGHDSAARKDRAQIALDTLRAGDLPPADRE